MNRKKIVWILSLTAIFLCLFPITKWSEGHFYAIELEPSKTGITTLEFYDAERGRPIVTEIWYPIHAETPSKPSCGFWMRCEEARDAPLSKANVLYPLIMMSHGNGGDRFNLAWLAEILAANGFVVAAIDHYGNTWNNKIPQCFATPWERPKDISFALSELLKSPFLEGRIDPEKIGFAGYSLGGATGMWIAGGKIAQIPAEKIGEFCTNEMPGIVSEELASQIDFNQAKKDYADSRVSAVFAIAPALGDLFDSNSLKAVEIPVCIIAAAKDQITPFERNAKWFSRQLSRATLKVFENDCTHYVFLSRASLIGKRVLESRFCEDPDSVDRLKIHQEVGKTAVQFFNSSLTR